MMALRNQPKAFALDVGDDQTHNLYYSVPKSQLGILVHLLYCAALFAMCEGWRMHSTSCPSHTIMLKQDVLNHTGIF